MFQRCFRVAVWKGDPDILESPGLNEIFRMLKMGLMSDAHPNLEIGGSKRTVDDVCERDRPKGTTSNQPKALINKCTHLRVLKEIKSAMRSIIN